MTGEVDVPGKTEVLIIGAGPTGLVLGLWLARLGVGVRIVDKAIEPGTTSRAVAVQARTLEFYSQIGLAEDVVERGRRAVAVNLWVAGERKARAAFGDLGEGISPFPFALMFPQDQHERLLIGRLDAMGVRVERGTELLDFVETAEGVVARMRAADGSEQRCGARYIAGCDGAHSRVRQTLGFGFQGGTYSHLFYVADVQATGATANGELHVALDRTDFLAVFPMKAEGRVRLVGTVRDEVAGSGEDLTWNDVNERVLQWTPMQVGQVNWFSTYRVHHRVADRFRKGRAFLLGDAAHIHSPVGGQGMNTGIGDAVNLAWKLAAVVQGRADAALLDSYEPERIAFARRLVATTDRAFTAVTSPGSMARMVRLRMVPFLLPRLFVLQAMRRLLFRTVSQTNVAYRRSSLSAGRVGAVRGGDRLPWVAGGGEGAGQDNFAALRSMEWQVHVYGEAAADLRGLCEERKLALQVLPWRPEVRRAGLRRNAVYVVRPDGYVGLAHYAAGAGAAVRNYLDARGLSLLGRAAARA